MIQENDHSAWVGAWMEQTAEGMPPEQFIQAFEQGFASLWKRAHQTLGVVTLMAIVDRVLYNAAEKFPLLSVIKVDANGLRCQELHEKVRNLPDERLAPGIRFILVEFLRILGELTSDILTPALHSELLHITQEAKPSDQKEASGGPPPAERQDDEGVKS